MPAALAAEDMLAADETPVNVLDKTPLPGPADDADEADPEEKDGKQAAGAPHVLIIRTPDGRLPAMLALASRSPVTWPDGTVSEPGRTSGRGHWPSWRGHRYRP